LVSSEQSVYTGKTKLRNVMVLGMCCLYGTHERDEMHDSFFALVFACSELALSPMKYSGKLTANAPTN
jgi:hypothetical protein